MARWWSRAGADPAPSHPDRTAAPPPRAGSLPAAVQRAAWRDVPPLTPTVTATSPVAPLDSFTNSLATAQNPSFLRPLDHVVDPTGPSGSVTGLASPVVPQAVAAGPDLPVVSRTQSVPGVVQRLLSPWIRAGEPTHTAVSPMPAGPIGPVETGSAAGAGSWAAPEPAFDGPAVAPQSVPTSEPPPGSPALTVQQSAAAPTPRGADRQVDLPLQRLPVTSAAPPASSLTTAPTQATATPRPTVPFGESDLVVARSADPAHPALALPADEATAAPDPEDASPPHAPLLGAPSADGPPAAVEGPALSSEHGVGDVPTSAPLSTPAATLPSAHPSPAGGAALPAVQRLGSDVPATRPLGLGAPLASGPVRSVDVPMTPERPGLAAPVATALPLGPALPVTPAMPGATAVQRIADPTSGSSTRPPAAPTDPPAAPGSPTAVAGQPTVMRTAASVPPRPLGLGVPLTSAAPMAGPRNDADAPSTFHRGSDSVALQRTSDLPVAASHRDSPSHNSSGSFTPVTEVPTAAPATPLGSARDHAVSTPESTSTLGAGVVDAGLPLTRDIAGSPSPAGSVPEVQRQRAVPVPQATSTELVLPSAVQRTPAHDPPAAHPAGPVEPGHVHPAVDVPTATADQVAQRTLAAEGADKPTESAPLLGASPIPVFSAERPSSAVPATVPGVVQRSSGRGAAVQRSSQMPTTPVAAQRVTMGGAASEGGSPTITAQRATAQSRPSQPNPVQSGPAQSGQFQSGAAFTAREMSFDRMFAPGAAAVASGAAYDDGNGSVVFRAPVADSAVAPSFDAPPAVQRFGIPGASSLLGSARSAAGGYADQATGFADRARGSAAGYAQTGAGYVDAARQAGGGYLDAARNAAGGYAETARNAAGGYAETARNLAGAGVNSARAAVGDAVDSARSAAGGVVDEATSLAHGAAGTASEAVHEAGAATTGAAGQASSAAAGIAGGAAGAVAGAAGAAAGALPTDLDELARRLFDPLNARLKSALWLDRERAGMVTDLRR